MTTGDKKFSKTFKSFAVFFLLSTNSYALLDDTEHENDDEMSVTTILNDESNTTSFNWPPPSDSLFAHYSKAAVASDNELCSEIGRDVLIEGGNAIDAMISSLLCLGTVNPQSSGLGGGFIMTLYNSSTGKCHTINALETATSSAFKTMFINNPETESIMRYKSIATPSELHGLWTVFNRYGSGKVSWARLFQSSIDLASNGFPVSSSLASALKDYEEAIRRGSTIKEIFVNPKTNQIYEEGEIMKRRTLGNFYALLANATDPVELFYKGGTAQTIDLEIADNGGFLRESDLASYETLIDDAPLQSTLGDYVMCGPPPPSSFVITQSIIQVMAQFYKNEKVNLNDSLVYHRLIEAEKFAYAQRAKLSDVKFEESAKTLMDDMMTEEYFKKIAALIKDTAQSLYYYGFDKNNMTNSTLDDELKDGLTELNDHESTHVSIIDSKGNAVSCTSSLNNIFGSMVASPTLGIIWNNQMDTFSNPKMNDSNLIQSEKRPMSSMSPIIIVNKNMSKVEMAVGASGGSSIISSTAQTVIRTLLFNETVKEAIDAPRFHSESELTETEKGMPDVLRDVLIEQYKQNFTIVDQQKSVVQALVSGEESIKGNSDYRRKTGTYIAGY